MDIAIDHLDGPATVAFLQSHLDDMRAVSPPESKHVLDLAGLRACIEKTDYPIPAEPMPSTQS